MRHSVVSKVLNERPETNAQSSVAVIVNNRSMIDKAAGASGDISPLVKNVGINY